MPTDIHDGLNVGELIRDGASLTTPEVLSILHEVCRHAGTAFPHTADDLWIGTAGDLLIARPVHSSIAEDPRTAVAALLEGMLPADDRDPRRTVPQALRGLPARLRAAAGGDVGPKDREDLISILSWHLEGDAREIIQRLARRVAEREGAAVATPVVVATAAAPAAVHDDFGLYADDATAPPAQPEPAPPPPAAGTLLRNTLSAFAVAALFVATGSVSYWWFRDPAVDHRIATDPDESPSIAIAGRITGPRPTATDARPAQPLPLAVNGGAFSPTFAANGRELFFHAGHSDAGQLHVASLDERGQVSRVSALLAERARNFHPRVSPDGRLLAFDSDREGERGVFVSTRDGSNPKRVSGNGYGAVPSWSPNMQWLAFVRGEAGRPQVWNLWLRDLSSGAVRRHTSFRSGQVWGAAWFPDGRSLCYSHDYQLVISHLDSRADIVIDSPRPGRLVRTPAVSPDGRQVVFQVFKDGAWLLDVQTRQMRRILDDPSAEEFAWAPDGRRIAYHSLRDGAWKIWMMTVPK